MRPKELRLFWFASENEAIPASLSALDREPHTSLDRLNSWESAKTLLEHEPDSVLLISGSAAVPPAIKRLLAKGANGTAIAVEDSSGAAVVRPGFTHQGVITADTSPSCTRKIILDSVEAKRKELRLAALREHHRTSRSFEGNPALALITDVVKACTASETYEDILESARLLEPSVQFSDAEFFLLSEDHYVERALSLSLEKRQKVVEIGEEGSGSVNLPLEFESPETTFIRPDSHFGAQLIKIKKQPWGSAVALGFRGNSSDQRAALILYRRDLFPFTEKDAWILELAYHPLSLALDKVNILSNLQQSSSRWRSTFDGISEGVTVINDDFEIVKANKAFAKLVDLDVKSLKGKKCYTLLSNKRSPCKECPVRNDRRESSGASVKGKKNNSIRVWSYSLGSGNENYHFQFYRDTSREVDLSSRLIQAEKIAALGKIVSAIAHELNNPLGGILATSQILLRDSKFTDELEEIHKAALRSKKIIDTLLGFTSESYRKAEAGTVGDAIQSTLMLVKSGIGKIKVKSKVGAPFTIVENFPALQQILFNLITNSIHAMGDRGEIILNASLDGAFVKISITDSGPGIPADRLKNIFDPFFTSKGEGSGTGLGLAIVKNLVERLGGHISVASKRGEGTTFTVTLPRGENRVTT